MMEMMEMMEMTEMRRNLRELTSPSAFPAFFSISSNFTVWLNKSSMQTSYLGGRRR